MKNLRLSPLALFAILLFPTSPAFSADVPAGWEGLWELTQETSSEPVTFHLWFPPGKGQAELYGNEWRPLVLIAWSVQGEKLSLNWQTSGVNTLFTGTRKEKVMSGDWKLAHPQFSVSGSFRGRLIHAIPDWAPLAFSPLPDQRTEVIDWAEQARKSKAAGKLPEFHASYFAVFKKILPDSLVDQTIETSSYKEKETAVRTALEDVIGKFSEVYKGANLPLDVLLIPSGETQHQFYIQDRLFLAINPQKFSLLPDPIQNRVRLAGLLFGASLDARFPPVDSAAFVYTKAALSLAWTQALGYTEDPAGILLADPAAYQSTRARLADLKIDIRKGKKLEGLEFQVVAFALGEYLGRSTLPTRDSTFDTQTVRELFGKFLRAEQ